MELQVLRYGVADYLRFVLSKGRPNPTSPALLLTIKTSENADLTTAVSAVDIIANLGPAPVTTTISAACVRGAEVITATALTNITEEKDLYLGSGLSGEWVKVKEIDAVTKILTLYNPLERSHASGTALETAQYYYLVASGNNASQQTKNRASLTYTMDGETVVEQHVYNVRFTHWTPTLTSARVEQAMSQAVEYASDDAKGLDGKIAESARMLQKDLLAMGFDIHNCMNSTDPEDAHLAACLFLIMKDWAVGKPDLRELRDDYERYYQKELEKLPLIASWWEDSPQDMSLGDTEAGRYARRMVLA